MLRVGMTGEEITTFLKETFCVDNTYTASALFNAAELPGASWASVRAELHILRVRICICICI